MSTKQSPRRVTLGMLKGKPIMTSPVIRYHASDDELEELYPSTDDDELFTPETNVPSTKPSPSKTDGMKAQDGGVEGNVERRAPSVIENLSEGTPPSDPWKMLSEIKGKIAKTFEEKLSEIKSERKKNKRRSCENSSISDSEDLVNVTPTEEKVSEHQEIEPLSSMKFSKNNSSRFSGFYNIKTGLKAKNSEEDSVESGIEAAEFAEEESLVKNDQVIKKNDNENPKTSKHADSYTKVKLPLLKSPFDKISMIIPQEAISNQTLSQTISQIIYRLLSLPFIILGLYYTIPLPDYIVGLIAGILVTITIQNVKNLVILALAKPHKLQRATEVPVPVVEIPAAEELAVVDRYEGWLNQLPFKYDPKNYRVARTMSVFFKLEGNVLKVMETRTRIPKREVWDEPEHKARFTRQNVYSLANASIELLPEGLIRRRRWSKKYPICITFARDALMESTLLNDTSESENLQKIEVDDAGTIHEEDETDEELFLAKDSKEVFEDRSEEDDTKLKMYIFARTDRQKEDWFRRLIGATKIASKRDSLFMAIDPALPMILSNSQSNNEDKGSVSFSVTSTGSSDASNELSYTIYMSHYTDMPMNSSTDTDFLEKRDAPWLNALISRILFDLHRCPGTMSLIQERIQRKLSNIKLPYFMESLVVSELIIGQGAPIIQKASLPTIDNRGLWVELDVSYEGCSMMTIETKLNLMKLTRAGSISNNSSDLLNIDEPKSSRSPMFDSDLEDSPETSTEEEDTANAKLPSASRDSTPLHSSGRKILNMVDKLTANKYFQHCADGWILKRLYRFDLRESLQKMNPTDVSMKPAGYTIHSNFKELCKSCLYNYLQQNLKSIKLPSRLWRSAMKRDQHVVFAKAEDVYPPTFIVNVVIEPGMNMKVYSKERHVDWLQREPMSMNDVSGILEILNGIDIFFNQQDC